MENYYFLEYQNEQMQNISGNSKNEKNALVYGNYDDEKIFLTKKCSWYFEKTVLVKI